MLLAELEAFWSISSHDFATEPSAIELSRQFMGSSTASCQTHSLAVAPVLLHHSCLHNRTYAAQKRVRQKEGQHSFLSSLFLWVIWFWPNSLKNFRAEMWCPKMSLQETRALSGKLSRVSRDWTVAAGHSPTHSIKLPAAMLTLPEMFLEILFSKKNKLLIRTPMSWHREDLLHN